MPTVVSVMRQRKKALTGAMQSEFKNRQGIVLAEEICAPKYHELFIDGDTINQRTTDTLLGVASKLQKERKKQGI